MNDPAEKVDIAEIENVRVSQSNQIGENQKSTTESANHNPPVQKSDDDYSNSNNMQHVSSTSKKQEVVNLDVLPTTQRKSLETGNDKSILKPDTTGKKLSTVAEPLDQDLDRFLIYTKAVDYPKIRDTIQERRFILRILQLMFGFGNAIYLNIVAAFLGVASTAFVSSFTTDTIQSSGIDIFCFVNIVSLSVSLSNMFMYAFPKLIQISPSRHKRVSSVEVALDLCTCIGWLIATSQLLVFSKCPNLSKVTGALDAIDQFLMYIDKSTKFCPSLVLTLVAGYATAGCYIVKILDGIRDHSVGEKVQKGKTIMVARGSWKS
ncbi:hypothetical protein BC833DRAFT_600120 [Globomyces pollinis-pini]|nr:hypothetical protein BC833DRAFT_600120 [Globomyces pollinis-pini]